MTSASINNFVGDLVAMAQAQERLPQVEAELKVAAEGLEKAYSTIAERETSILNYKSEIDGLHARIRSLEVERDDAAFRNLELEDSLKASVRAFRAVVDEAESAISVIEPSKPIAELPVAEPTTFDDGIRYPDEAMDPADPRTMGQSATDPIPPNGVTNIPITESGVVGENISQSNNAQPEAVSANSVASVEITDAASLPDTTPSRSLTEADVAAEYNEAKNTVDPSKRYFGLNYWTLPGFISEADWLAGGGNLNNYKYGTRNDPKFDVTASTDDMPF